MKGNINNYIKLFLLTINKEYLFVVIKLYQI